MEEVRCYTNNPNKREVKIHFTRFQCILRFSEMDCFSNEEIMERRRVVERLVMGKWDTGP